MQTINEESAGTYLVHTWSGSQYLLDLDRGTLTRHAGTRVTDDRDLRRDDEIVDLLRVANCTVNESMVLIIDLHWPNVVFTTRRTTEVTRIDRIEPVESFVPDGIV